MRGLETAFLLLPFPLSLFYSNYFDTLSVRRLKKNEITDFILFFFTQQILTTVKLLAVGSRAQK